MVVLVAAVVSNLQAMVQAVLEIPLALLPLLLKEPMAAMAIVLLEGVEVEVLGELEVLGQHHQGFQEAVWQRLLVF
jgi:hypothetical protein